MIFAKFIKRSIAAFLAPTMLLPPVFGDFTTSAGVVVDASIIYDEPVGDAGEPVESPLLPMPLSKTVITDLRFPDNTNLSIDIIFGETPASYLPPHLIANYHNNPFSIAISSWMPDPGTISEVIDIHTLLPVFYIDEENYELQTIPPAITVNVVPRLVIADFLDAFDELGGRQFSERTNILGQLPTKIWVAVNPEQYVNIAGWDSSPPLDFNAPVIGTTYTLTPVFEPGIVSAVPVPSFNISIVECVIIEIAGDFDDEAVLFGTPLGSLDLPTNLTTKTYDGEEIDLYCGVHFEWNNNYDGETPDLYMFEFKWLPGYPAGLNAETEQNLVLPHFIIEVLPVLVTQVFGPDLSAFNPNFNFGTSQADLNLLAAFGALDVEVRMYTGYEQRTLRFCRPPSNCGLLTARKSACKPAKALTATQFISNCTTSAAPLFILRI